MLVFQRNRHSTRVQFNADEVMPGLMRRARRESHATTDIQHNLILRICFQNDTGRMDIVLTRYLIV